MLTEGYADSIAVAEAGCSAAAVFGSGLHFPQLEHLKRLKPQLILLGFDADGAGLRGTENAEVMLAGRQTARVNWAYYGGKDPSEITLDERMAAIANAVIGAGYPDPLDAMVASRNLAMERWEHIKDDRGSAVG
jgi:DNA primase